MKSLKLFLGSIALTAMIFTSCEDEKTNPIAENGSATISGIAFVNLDARNDTNTLEDLDYNYVPAGTVLFATFSSENLTLSPNSNVNYEDIIVETTVGGNGVYSFTVPANQVNFSVAITGDDFNTVYTASDELSYDEYFALSSVEVSGIHNGADRKVNLYYEAK